MQFAIFQNKHCAIQRDLEIAQRARIRQLIKTERQIGVLRRTSEALITSFGEDLLLDTLSEELPKLEFPSFFLSLFDDPAQSALSSRLILAYDDGHGGGGERAHGGKAVRD